MVAPRFVFGDIFPAVFRFSLFGVSAHVLAEVVVCAVGWVATLPAMEMTAQATALLVLGSSLQPKERNRETRRSFFCAVYSFNR